MLTLKLTQIKVPSLVVQMHWTGGPLLAPVHILGV